MAHDHPAIVVMFKQRIISELLDVCVVDELENSAWRTGNYQAKILFESKDSQAKGETTVLQNRVHPSQQQFFEFLSMLKLQIVPSVLSVSHMCMY